MAVFIVITRYEASKQIFVWRHMLQTNQKQLEIICLKYLI